MPRPAMNSKLTNKHLTNEEKQSRECTENQLKGNSDTLHPAEYLNKRQKAIFDYIVNNLKESNLLGNLDIYLLHTTSIAIQKLEELEGMINQDITLLEKSSIRGSLKHYSQVFYKGCTELCLSPQSRAKLAISFKPDEEDPLLAILRRRFLIRF